jgi:phage shock protein C
MEKQLRRSKQDSVLGGVAGGLANYFNIDVVIVRLLFVVSLLVSFGVSLFAYIVLWVVLPEETFYHFGKAADGSDLGTPDQEAPPVRSSADSGDRNLKIIAIGLIGFGTYMLLDQYIIWYNIGKYFWPLALIGLGAFLLLRKRDQDFQQQQSSEGPADPRWPGGGTDTTSTPHQSTQSAEDKGDSEESFKVN